MTAVLAAMMLVGAAAATAAAATKAPPAQVGTHIQINGGIGKLTVGLLPAQVRKLLGAPSKTAHVTDASGKRRVLRMDYSRYALSLLFDWTAGEPNAVSVIDVDGPRYRTSGGIHVGSSKAALLRAHPETSCGSLSGGKPGEEVCAIAGDGRRTTFVTTKAHRIRTIEIGTD